MQGALNDIDGWRFIKMQRKTILVTGSTDGIGKETALQLANKGAEIILHGRNQEKGRRVLKEIQDRTGNNNLQFFLADLASLRQVRNLVADIKDNYNRLNVLINNAGTFQQERTLTEDGLETTFAVNYIAPFLLTNELLETMKRSAPSRIINVASIAHWNGKLDWKNLQGERRYEGFDAYATSKLVLILFTYALTRRLEGSNVTANCLHPGVIKTKLLRAGFGDYPGDTPEKGAQTSVYLASSPKVEGLSGQYHEACKVVRSSPITYDREIQEELWSISERLARL
jgi:NAD(P)-dependent dehydrogenase (short-subunit alcohol dehydrogenase family)